jgi:hypothetical protein
MWGVGQCTGTPHRYMNGTRRAALNPHESPVFGRLSGRELRGDRGADRGGREKGKDMI